MYFLKAFFFFVKGQELLRPEHLSELQMLSILQQKPLLLFYVRFFKLMYTNVKREGVLLK